MRRFCQRRSGFATADPMTITRRCDPLPFPSNRRTCRSWIVRKGISVPHRAGLRLRIPHCSLTTLTPAPTGSRWPLHLFVSRHEARFCANFFVCRTLTSNYLCLEELTRNGAINHLFSGGGEGVPITPPTTEPASDLHPLRSRGVLPTSKNREEIANDD